MRTKDNLKKLMGSMIDNDKTLVKHFEKIDSIINLDYTLPSELGDLPWTRTVPSTDPQSAVKTARRTLATVFPIPEFQPLWNNKGTQELASQIEKNLKWQLKQSNKRSRKDVVGDVVESALRYDKIAVFVMPLSWQMEGQAGFDGEIPSRYKAAKNMGDFMVMNKDPKGVYARWTPLGLDAVFEVAVRKAREVASFYGDNAKELLKEIEDEDSEMWVTEFSYWDYDQRFVGCSEPSQNKTQARPGEIKYVFTDEEMELPFLPWVIREGGTSLESDPIHAYNPLLGTVAKSKMWETMNICLSLAMSESIAHAAAPRYAIKSVDGELRIDYGDINKPVNLKPGEEIINLNPPQIDQNLMLVADRIQAMIDKDTVAKLLQNLDIPGGSAFATVNALIKTATAALDPYRMLAEQAIAGVWELMLRWTHHTKEPMMGFGMDRDNKTDYGEQLQLKPKHIDPENIYIDCKLSASVPTDYLQRIEAAIAMIQQLDFSKNRAYKYLDVTDPDVVMDERAMEKLEEVEMQVAIQERMAQSQMKMQQFAQRQQMQAQQAQAQRAQRAQAQRPSLQGRQFQQRRAGAPRREALSQAARGNPARTGISPNQSNPEGNLRERRTGRDREGVPV